MINTAPSLISYQTDEGEWSPVTFKSDPGFFLCMGGSLTANLALYAGAVLGNTACRAYVAGCLAVYTLSGLGITYRLLSEKKHSQTPSEETAYA